MALLYFSLLHFSSADLKYSNFSFQIHWGCLITPKLPVLLQNQNVLPTGPAFCWDEQDKGNIWKIIRQTARSWELGTWPAVLGNVGFSQRICSSGVLSLWKEDRWILVVLGRLETSDREESTLRASWKFTQQPRSPSPRIFVGAIFLVFTENRSSNWRFSSTVSNGEAFCSENS